MKPKTMTISWQELLKDKQELPTMPDGYSTASMIAKKMGFTICHVTSLMKEARESGKIKAIKGKNNIGQITWFYKD